MYEEEERKNKLNDIECISFGTNIEEITSSLEIVLMLFEIDDDREIITACKKKLDEGIQLLKQLGQENRSKEFEV